MKHAFWSAGLVIFGIVGVSFVVAFENIAVNNESEYYGLKEAVEASMYESIDLDYYRMCTEDTSKCPYGDFKIIEEKFVANCTRRFFANINGTGDGYKLEFYDIMESPPKVTVVATSSTDSYDVNLEIGKDANFDIVNNITAILEYK